MRILKISAWLLATSTMATLVHCGGATFVDPGAGDPDAGQTGATTTGAGGAGTTSSTATSSSTFTVSGSTATGAGGVATSTTSTGGGGSATAGQGGVGGSSGGSSGDDACKLPKVVGPCDAAVPAWWHNAATGVCEPFIYGGCQGNANRFDSLEACQRICHGGTPDMDACNVPTDCTLVAAQCCACEPADARAFVAVNRAYSKAYYGNSQCAAVDCAGCPLPTEPMRTRQYFAATCTAGNCTVVDIRKTDLTSCATTDECYLRDGAECCEGCDGMGIVALSKKADLGSLGCGMPPQPCLACAPNIPTSYAAICSNARCTVGFLR